MPFSAGLTLLSRRVPFFRAFNSAAFANAPLAATRPNVYVRVRVVSFVSASECKRRGPFVPFTVCSNAHLFEMFRSFWRHPFVGCILASCNPSTVFSAIISVCINAVNFVLRRSRPHIGHPCSERRSPFVADFDPALPVVFVAHAARIVTTLFHRAPNAIERMFGIAVLNFAWHRRLQRAF